MLVEAEYREVKQGQQRLEDEIRDLTNQKDKLTSKLGEIATRKQECMIRLKFYTVTSVNVLKEYEAAHPPGEM